MGVCVISSAIINSVSDNYEIQKRYINTHSTAQGDTLVNEIFNQFCDCLNGYVLSFYDVHTHASKNTGTVRLKLDDKIERKLKRQYKTYKGNMFDHFLEILPNFFDNLYKKKVRLEIILIVSLA